MKKILLPISVVLALFLLTPVFAADSPPIKLNIYGDSISAGITAENPTFQSVIRSHYVGQDVGVLNVAVPGATAADMDLVVQRYVGSGQTHAHILVGTNDIANGTAPGVIADQIETSIQRLLDSGVARVFVGTVLPRGLAGYASGSLANLTALNTRIRNMPTALASSRVVVIEYHDNMGEPGLPNELLHAADFGDGLHTKRYTDMWEIFEDDTAGYLPAPTTP